MNFHIGKIYSYKSNKPRLWAEYCKKIKTPYSAVILEPNTSSCIIIQESDEISNFDSDNDSWVDMKKIL
jgi:hypothetical protein